jgi:hypothetical protein
MKLVYVPCAVNAAVAGPAIVTDADGHPHAVTEGRLELVDRLFCVVALWLEEKSGRHLVRFRDESECWVKPSACWKYEPDDFNPPTIRSRVRPLEIGARRRVGSTA